MGLVVNIVGTSRSIRSLSISATQNGKDTCSCEFDSADGTQIIDIDEVIAVVEDGTTIFGGTVKTPTVIGKGDAVIAITNKFNAIDYNELADRDMIFGMTIVGGGTTRAALQAILDGGYLPGVTNGMPTGPDTSPVIADDMTFDGVYVTAALEEIGTRSGWLHEINYSKVASFFAIGSRSAPWNVADGDGNAVGNITTSKSRLQYYNRWVIQFTAAAQSAYAHLQTTSNFVANDIVTIGGRAYTYKASPSAADEVQLGANATDSLNSLISAILSGVGGGVIHPSVGAYLRADGVTMTATALTAGVAGNSIAVTVTLASATASWITEGGGGTATLLFGSDEALTNRAIVNDLAQQALYGVYTGRAEAPSVFELTSAEALGTMMLADSVVVVTTVNYLTRRAGLFPGMTQTIQASRRFLNNACLITEVRTQMLNEGALMDRFVTAIYNSASGVGDTFRSSPWRDQYRKWAGSGSSAQTVSGSGGGGSTPSAVGRYIPLQMNAGLFVQVGTGGLWAPADGMAAGQSGIQIYLDPTELGTTIGTIYVRLKAASGSVTARLRNAGNTYTAGTSTAVTSTTYVTVSFPVSIIADYYLLEISPSVAGIAGRANGVGYLKV